MNETPTPYRFSCLTEATLDKRSPIRAYLDSQFTGRIPELQREYRKNLAPLLIDGDPRRSPTTGSAVDLMIRFILQPDQYPTVATLGVNGRPNALGQVESVIATAQELARSGDFESETFVGACYVLALTTEIYRAGLSSGSPLIKLGDFDDWTHDGLMSLPSREALQELLAIGKLAQTNLLPHLGPEIVCGPTFDGSALCNADGDFIASGLLLDVKAGLGPARRPSGLRYDALPQATIHQLITYALFDRSDRYRIDAVGVYLARYGRFEQWPLLELMERLGGRRVSLAEERETMWRILETGFYDGTARDVES